MRLENAARNVKAAWILQLVHILCQFFSRTVIIKVLTIEYVGLSGLFSNVLTMLSLAELGIGEAIIFSLYGPIARKERENITAIMAFYKKVYIAVGVFILVVGLAITPYIGVFIKDMPDIPEIYLIYMLYVINSSVSYFFSYKAAFVTATQNNYIVVLNNGIWEVLMVACQAIALFMFKNYVAFMIIGIAFVLIQNISITIIANRKYPFLKDKHHGKIPKDIFGQIKKNTGAMVFHKIGTIIVFATDNMIISKFVGLVSVGLYANYCTITNSVTVFINKFFNAISASVGNLAVEEDVETQERTYLRVLFINFWLYVFSCCCLMNLLNPFIGSIWLGDEYLFTELIVLLIVVKTYITGMRSATQTFKNAKGLYWQNRYMPIYESIINLVASLILVQYMGVAGVLLGTIISSLATCVWREPYVLYRTGFGKSVKSFLIIYIKYFIVFALIMALTYLSVHFISIGGIIGFVIKCIVSAIIPNVVMLMIYRKTDEFKYVLDIVKKKIVKR